MTSEKNKINKILEFLREERNRKVLVFVIRAFLLYVSWIILYELVIQPYTKLDLRIINNLIHLSSKILEFMGFRLIEFPFYDENIRTMGIDGTHGLWIGDPCNGLNLFALFTGFILIFPGALKHKLWFIPFGLLAIHTANIVRIVGLSVVTLYWPDWLEFNHTYTFTILVYSMIFILWMWWVKKFSNTRS